MAVNLRKFVGGTDKMRWSSLWQDLVTIEAALNTQLSNIKTVINAFNLTVTGVLTALHGGTGFSSYAKGDILAGNASATLSKVPVGADGQVLTADAASPAGLKYTSPASAIPEVLSVNTSYTGANNYITQESITVNAGVQMTIGDSTRFMIGRSANDSELYFVELGADAPTPTIGPAFAINLSTVGDRDWYVNSAAFNPGPIISTGAVHAKRSGGDIMRSFRWTSNYTVSTFAGQPQVSSNTADDSFGAAISAGSTFGFVGNSVTNGFGWQLSYPVTMTKQVMVILSTPFQCDMDLTVSFSNPKIPTKTIRLTASQNGALVNSANGNSVKITFWGTPCTMRVSAVGVNSQGVNGNINFQYAYVTALGAY